MSETQNILQSWNMVWSLKEELHWVLNKAQVTLKARLSEKGSCKGLKCAPEQQIQNLGQLNIFLGLFFLLVTDVLDGINL